MRPTNVIPNILTFLTLFIRKYLLINRRHPASYHAVYQRYKRLFFGSNIAMFTRCNIADKY